MISFENPFAVRHFGKKHKATLQADFAKKLSSPSRTGKIGMVRLCSKG